MAVADFLSHMNTYLLWFLFEGTWHCVMADAMGMLLFGNCVSSSVCKHANLLAQIDHVTKQYVKTYIKE